MRISEAYSILSSATKRAKYDREHMNIAHPAHAAHAHRKGSYASTGPAGGRPASGLSRRRGTFRGPPPSFFRSGGWGAQSEKRKTAHEESTGGAASASASRPGAGAGQTSGKGTAGGMGPGQDPFGHRDDVPHFDKESHERTGRNIDRRREARRGVENDFGERVPIEIDRGVAGMFFVISGILLLSFAGPFFISRLWYGGGQRSKEKGKDPAKG
jgi:curved DNA-binding protein CbpA